MVFIINCQFNILQDIDFFYLFVQVVISICKSFDEREIIRNVYEFLSVFDELVMFGYCENLIFSQIKMFIEMESYEECIQEIIVRVSSFIFKNGYCV